MAVRANASKLKRNAQKVKDQLRQIDSETGYVVRDVMDEDLIDAIDTELSSVDYSRQVGFNKDLFISNLRSTLREDADGSWIIDPWEAGGSEEELDLITGVREEINGRTQSLWHEGKGRTSSFFRLIYANASARQDLAFLREQIWGDLTPQWYLLNYGSPEADQPATMFIEKALSNQPIDRIKRIAKGILKWE